MLIGNIKSNRDLEAKKDLQKQLLELEASNELENQKRQKAKTKVLIGEIKPPEYKPTGEIQSDRASQEKKALELLIDFGLPYQDAGNVTNWLGQNNRLSAFIASYKGLKKELLDNYDKSIITPDFLKDYLAGYFEDYDVNLGKKFSRDVARPAETDLELDIKSIPSKSEIQVLVDKLINISSFALTINTKNKIREIVGLLNIYKELVPDEYLRLEVSLTQNERKQIARDLSKALVRINYITRGDYEDILKLVNNIVAGYNAPTVGLKVQSGVASQLDPLLRRISRQLSLILNPSNTEGLMKVYKNIDKKTEESSGGFRQLLEGIENEIEKSREAFIDIIQDAGDTSRENQYIREDIGDYAYFRGLDIEDFDERMKAVEERGKEKRIKPIEPLEPKDKRPPLLPKYTEGVDIGDYQRALYERKSKIEAEEVIEKVKRYNKSLPEERKKYVSKLITDISKKPIVFKNLEMMIYEKFVDFITSEQADVLNKYMQLPIPAVLTPKEKSDVKLILLDAVEGFSRRFPEYDPRLNQEEFGWTPLTYGRNKTSIAIPFSPEELERFPADRQPAGIYGLGKGKLLSKLKKHFKGDEALLRKVVKSIEEDTSSESELEEELSRHQKATSGLDKKIEKGIGFKATRISTKKVGKGVKLEKEDNPTYRQFGKYVIHIPYLLNNNVANFKYPSLGGIPSLKPTTISNDYKDLLLETLQTGKLNKKELERLPQAEIKHFERVAIGAGLVEQLGLKVGSADEDKADAKRFELLRGEYLAGNNNNDLLKELRQLITKFVNNGRMHKTEGLNLLLELSTL